MDLSRREGDTLVGGLTHHMREKAIDMVARERKKGVRRRTFTQWASNSGLLHLTGREEGKETSLAKHTWKPRRAAAVFACGMGLGKGEKGLGSLV